MALCPALLKCVRERGGGLSYRCGHQEQDFIYAREDFIADRLAEFARHLCLPCQMREEQQQFEAVLRRQQQQAAAEPELTTIYIITYQNGALAAATPTRPGYCQVALCWNGQAPFYDRELEVSQVTTELRSKGFKSLYWGDHMPAELEGCLPRPQEKRR
jgi:hypothetical protein